MSEEVVRESVIKTIKNKRASPKEGEKKESNAFETNREKLTVHALLVSKAPRVVAIGIGQLHPDHTPIDRVLLSEEEVRIDGTLGSYLAEAVADDVVQSGLVGGLSAALAKAEHGEVVTLRDSAGGEAGEYGLIRRGESRIDGGGKGSGSRGWTDGG